MKINNINELWKKQLDKDGLKFFVIKSDDLFDLSEEQVNEFNDILYQINKNRAKKGKSPSNKYWVVNRDEDYSREIKKIIEKNEGIKLKD